MMLRRDFVRNFFVSTVALTAGSRLLAAAARPAAWSGAAFQRAHGTVFRVHGPDGVQDLLLDQVAHRSHGRTEMASLRFCGRTAARLAEGTYSFQHPDLGRMPLFIVPGTATGNDCFYRVTMGRMV